MKVSIKDMAISMEVKNRGIEFEVRNTEGQHLGDLLVTKAGLIWCSGRTHRKNGVRLSWQEFIGLVAAKS